ncbi:uncharacterized protein C12orf45-like [Anneissia japonica]|uniref:uncharacterized protein C12orf45-like n=1 Tax=Anneissia japonica TaxID=1529436 RepID=UPI00142559C6|nr:uncharacterized protein C12orf45-like [Anneissia japonica]
MEQKLKEIVKEPLNANNSGLAYSLLIDSKRPTRLPPSSVLSKVKSFLPAMKAANEDLMMNAAEDGVGLELPENYDGPAIQMDLTQFALDSSSDDSSDEEDPPITEYNLQTTASVANQKHRPTIEVLAATDSQQASCTQTTEGVTKTDSTVK